MACSICGRNRALVDGICDDCTLKRHGQLFPDVGRAEKWGEQQEKPASATRGLGVLRAIAENLECGEDCPECGEEVPHAESCSYHRSDPRQQAKRALDSAASEVAGGTHEAALLDLHDAIGQLIDFLRPDQDVSHWAAITAPVAYDPAADEPPSKEAS